MIPGSAVHTRLACPDDLEEIGRLLPDLAVPGFSERFPRRTVADFCRWKYFSNPLGDAAVGVALNDHRVVSLVAGVPKRIFLGAETVVAFELGDLITAPSYRNRGSSRNFLASYVKKLSAGGRRWRTWRRIRNRFPFLPESSLSAKFKRSMSGVISCRVARLSARCTSPVGSFASWGRLSCSHAGATSFGLLC